MRNLANEQEFNEIISTGDVSVVKFYTTWCPDCKKLNGFIDEIISENGDKHWYEVNGEDVPDISEKYEVRGVPSLLVFQNGEKIAHLHSKFTKTPEQVREFMTSLK